MTTDVKVDVYEIFRLFLACSSYRHRDTVELWIRGPEILLQVFKYDISESNFIVADRLREDYIT